MLSSREPDTTPGTATAERHPSTVMAGPPALGLDPRVNPAIHAARHDAAIKGNRVSMDARVKPGMTQQRQAPAEQPPAPLIAYSFTDFAVSAARTSWTNSARRPKGSSPRAPWARAPIASQPKLGASHGSPRSFWP